MAATTADPTGGAAPSGVGLLGNGSAFLMPTFGNMPWFGYAGLQAQMEDAQQAWAKGAGVFAGNNVPKYNGVAGGPGVPPSFAGGFANMPANVGGSQYGKQAYSGGFDPFRGRGLLSGGGPPGGGTPPPGGGTPPPGGGTPPPGGGTPPPGTTPPGNGVWPIRPDVPNQPPNAGGITNPGLLNNSSPQNTSTVGAGVGGITGLLGAAGSAGAPPKGLPTGGPAPYPNTFTSPAVNSNTAMVKTASGKDAPNPFGLTSEQIYWALSGHPDAARRLSDALGATGGQTMQGGQLSMSPQNQLFHQIMNYYASGGGAFNSGYTPEDAAKAQASYMAGMGTPYTGQTFAPGLPMFASMEEARKAGYA